MSRQWKGVSAGALALAVAVGLALGVSSAGAGQQALPRAQTLYMSGNQWSPNNDLNPAKNWDYVTGLVGFAYETPFRYDPLKDTFIPWLATGGKWTSPTTYTMTIRQDVKWSDGKPHDGRVTSPTASTSLKIATHPQHPLWHGHGAEERQGRRVRTSSSRSPASPAIQQFDFYRFNVAIVPQHIFKNYSKTDITTGQPRRTSKHRRHRPVRLPVRVSERAVARRSWGGTTELVGDQGARPQGRADVRRRHQERDERGGARRTSGREHRPVQQLRPEGGDQGQVQDVLQRGAVPPGREHDLALPEHDARSRSNDPQFRRRSPTRSTWARSSTRRTRASSTRRARRACCRSGTSGSTRASSSSTASRTTRRRPRRSSPPPATRTRTATATSRTRTARRST